MKRVFIYTRVSTLDQSVELQKRELSEYCQRQGWTVAKIFEDKQTGTNANRPGLIEMNYLLRKKEADTVLVFKLDRIFRSSRDCILQLQDWMENGIEFISLRDPALNNTPSGRLLMHLISAFSEFEASLCSMRVKAGLDHARSKNIKLGRPSRKDLKEIFQMRKSGMSLDEIGKEVKLTKSSISKILKKGLN